jgi:hypothetical protein
MAKRGANKGRAKTRGLTASLGGTFKARQVRHDTKASFMHCQRTHAISVGRKTDHQMAKIKAIQDRHAADIAAAEQSVQRYLARKTTSGHTRVIYQWLRRHRCTQIIASEPPVITQQGYSARGDIICRHAPTGRLVAIELKSLIMVRLAKYMSDVASAPVSPSAKRHEKYRQQAFQWIEAYDKQVRAVPSPDVLGVLLVADDMATQAWPVYPAGWTRLADLHSHRPI